MGKKQKEILFILIVIFIIFLEIIFFGTYATYQILILVPFCMILSANLFNYLFQYLPHLKFLLYILFGIILIVNLLILGGVYSNFISGNMCSGFFPEDNLPSFPSKNIYSLARYLQEHKIYHPIITDDTDALNLGPNLDVLTFLKVKPILFNIDAFKKESTFRDSMFLTSNLENFYKTINLTNDTLSDLNKTMIINKTFYLGNEKIEYLLFQIK